MTSLRQTPVEANWCTVTIFDVAIVEAVAGQGGAGGRDAAVLEQVETRRGRDGGRRAGAGRRVPLGERLHGREDQSQAVGHVLVGSTGQSWGVALQTRTNSHKCTNTPVTSHEHCDCVSCQSVPQSGEYRKNHHPIFLSSTEFKCCLVNLVLQTTTSLFCFTLLAQLSCPRKNTY